MNRMPDFLRRVVIAASLRNTREVVRRRVRARWGDEGLRMDALGVESVSAIDYQLSAINRLLRC
jgi:hypothetical protein